jgi:hypothetical protein
LQEVRTWLERTSSLISPLGTGNNLGEGQELEVRRAGSARRRRMGRHRLADSVRRATAAHAALIHEEYARAGGPSRTGFFGE